MILISASVGVISIASWLTTLIAVSSIVTEEYAAETEFDEKKIDGHRIWLKDFRNLLGKLFTNSNILTLSYIHYYYFTSHYFET